MTESLIVTVCYRDRLHRDPVVVLFRSETTRLRLGDQGQSCVFEVCCCRPLVLGRTARFLDLQSSPSVRVLQPLPYLLTHLGWVLLRSRRLDIF